MLAISKCHDTSEGKLQTKVKGLQVRRVSAVFLSCSKSPVSTFYGHGAQWQDRLIELLGVQAFSDTAFKQWLGAWNNIFITFQNFSELQNSAWAKAFFFFLIVPQHWVMSENNLFLLEKEWLTPLERQQPQGLWIQRGLPR